MKSTSRVIETTALEKTCLWQEKGKDVVQAKITRTFSYRGNTGVIVGILIHTCLCNDAYLNEMAEGDVLPGVCNPRESHQEFFLVQWNRVHVPLGSVSYNKARRMAENQTTFFGRIRNWITIQRH